MFFVFSMIPHFLPDCRKKRKISCMAMSKCIKYYIFSPLFLIKMSCIYAIFPSFTTFSCVNNEFLLFLQISFKCYNILIIKQRGNGA